MIRSEKSKSVTLSRAPTPKSPTFPPMPAVGNPGRTMPNPINVFTNEANAKGARMGSMSVNPGKSSK